MIPTSTAISSAVSLQDVYKRQDISLTVKKGQTIGIIGGTGSGKSSLVNLIPRFYDVREGACLLYTSYLYHHTLRRNESLRELQFPYEYRTGQKELAVSVYRALARRRNLFIQAPTGIGKTLSVVYPSLKSMGNRCV